MSEWNELGVISRLLLLIGGGVPPEHLNVPQHFLRHPIQWMRDLFQLVTS